MTESCFEPLHTDQLRNGEANLLLLTCQEEQVVGFNPLIGQGDAYARAYFLLNLLKQQSEGWGVQLEETLRNCLIALAESGWSILEVEPLLSDAAFRASVLTLAQDQGVQSFFARFDRLSEEQKTGWVLPVLNKVTPLIAIPRLRRMLAQREGFSFERQLNEHLGSAVLVSLGIDKLH